MLKRKLQQSESDNIALHMEPLVTALLRGDTCAYLRREPESRAAVGEKNATGQDKCRLPEVEA